MKAGEGHPERCRHCGERGLLLGGQLLELGKTGELFSSELLHRISLLFFFVPHRCVCMYACKTALYPELIYFLFQWEHLAHGFLSQCCTSEASAASFQISIFIFPHSLQLFSGFAKHVI